MDTETGSERMESQVNNQIHSIGSVSQFRYRLEDLIGDVPPGDDFTNRMRQHQGWWRAFVIGVPPGPHPKEAEKGRVVCSMIPPDSRIDGFLDQEIRGVVEEVLAHRGENSSGIIEERRLRYNLLSSQPLGFNFFAPLYRDNALAMEILRTFFPALTQVTGVFFEYAPKERYTGDNSAFDVAIEGTEDGKRILIGFECKYTDTFSHKKYDYPEYKTVFDACLHRWGAPYEAYVDSRYNQLFRNQLIAEALTLHGSYAKVYTGLFCSEQDPSGPKIALEFQCMLTDGPESFKLLTYRDFVTAIQRLDVPWKVREWSMMLWARYQQTLSTQLVK